MAESGGSEQDGHDMVFADASLAQRYITFRPQPPQALVQRVTQHWKAGLKGQLPEKSVLVDVGCGSGQSCHQFAEHFDTVVGVDISPDQLQQGRERYKHLLNVSFVEGSAEDLPFAASSVDVITVCAAAHWFQLQNFYRQVDGVLRPGGVLAVYSYWNAYPIYNSICLRDTIMQVWEGLGFWPQQHQHLRTGYTALPAAYADDVYVSAAEGGFEVSHPSDLAGLLGYCSSWSALLKYQQKHGEEALQDYLKQAKQQLQKAMGTTEENPSITLRFRYFMRMWRKPLVL
uniref:Methyltransferase DDB_G0268948 n=2 Tax=Hirondellea gigas TaxID=1518452 RepID=A0A6A7G8P1_9CRUS